MIKHRIPFNKPYLTGNELSCLEQAIQDRDLSGNGQFTKRCQRWLEETMGCHKAFLVHSGTAALELGTLLLDLQPGDEVVMPSFTFVTVATAVVLRGAIPVFVDIRPDTLNIDENLLADSITNRTKAIMPVHYAGVGCEMNKILEVAKAHQVKVFEDAAHAVSASYAARPLGSFGCMAATSFHETKNLTCGEGGALLINDEALVERAEILVEKGTNRASFFLGLTDKYTWYDVGSSFLPSELEAAFLWAQMQAAQEITANRLQTWNYYHRALEPLEQAGYLRRPIIPASCAHNAHLFYILLDSIGKRNAMLEHLSRRGIGTVFHYVPLHDSPAGKRFGRVSGSMDSTNHASSCLLRLPLWVGLQEPELSQIVDAVFEFFGEAYPGISLDSVRKVSQTY